MENPIYHMLPKFPPVPKGQLLLVTQSGEENKNILVGRG
jgi:hypothetical protein